MSQSPQNDPSSNEIVESKSHDFSAPVSADRRETANLSAVSATSTGGLDSVSSSDQSFSLQTSSPQEQDCATTADTEAPLQGASPFVDRCSEEPTKEASITAASDSPTADAESAQQSESDVAQAGLTAGETGTAASAKKRSGFRSLLVTALRTLLVAILLILIVGAAWVKFTPEGKATWHELAPLVLPAGVLDWFFGDNSRDLEIAERLKSLGAVVIWCGDSDHKRIGAIDFQQRPPEAEVLALLAELPELSSVSLTHCELGPAQIEQLGHLTQVVSLALGGTKISDEDLQHIAKMRRLTALFLSDTPITDAALIELTRLPNLRILDLTRTKVTDSGMAALARCPRIEHLLIGYTAVTDAGLDQLHRTPKLRRVTLPGTATTAEGRERLKAAFTEIAMTIDF